MRSRLSRCLAAIRSLLPVLVLLVYVVSAQAQKPTGTIAYIRGGKTPGDEIRLIHPDGSDDHAIWKLTDVVYTGVTGLSWRPDGKEIAFSSDQDAAVSVYDSNIFAIHSDGTGLRRLTDTPGHSELAKYAKGKVTVTVRNYRTRDSLFLIYVAGALNAQQAVIPTNGSKTLVFPDVADFGAHPHAIVAISGIYRWIVPGPIVHAGKSVNGGVLNITANGMRNFGLSGPVWSSDGKKIGCILGDGAGLYSVPDSPVPGSEADNLIGSSGYFGATTYDLGPTPPTANQILYGGGVDNNAFRLTKQGSGAKGEALVEYEGTEVPTNVAWLPDASGFLFGKNDFTQANIYRYDFATKQVTQITHLTQEFAYNFCISPDGRWIAFDRRASNEAKPDLWLMRMDGSDMHLLVKHGGSPAWTR